jgi:2-polyprenyl-6-methoxyphenol hydroxylase-like FAD-dependent oxidoreductase
MAKGSRRVVIIGGSLVGLIAGNLLHRMGVDVSVFEKADGVREGRGAGITVLPGLVEGLQAAGVDVTEESLGVVIPKRVVLDRAGAIVAERPFPQVMTSWRLLFDLLKSVFPGDRYHEGVAVQRVELRAEKAIAYFDTGGSIDADLIVGADGFRSTVRAQLLPDVKPFYAGYIAWRCLADESEFSAAAQQELFNSYMLCLVPGEQAIAYPVPGPDQSFAKGRRQCNVVWYHPVDETEELRDLLTDGSGRYHPNGISPALIRPEVRDRMMALAAETLAPQFSEAIRRSRLVFFQPIADLASPRMAFGRAAIIGDAAFVARPHVAMGVPKGAGDALALAEALARDRANISEALADFEAERLRIDNAIVNRGKYLGSYMEAQSGSPEARRDAEERRVPETVMMETAAYVDYDRRDATF